MDVVCDGKWLKNNVFEALKRKDGKVIFFLDSVVKVFGCSACCLTKNFCLMTICIQKVQVFGWQVKFLDKKMYRLVIVGTKSVYERMKKTNKKYVNTLFFLQLRV